MLEPKFITEEAYTTKSQRYDELLCELITAIDTCKRTGAGSDIVDIVETLPDWALIDDDFKRHIFFARATMHFMQVPDTLCHSKKIDLFIVRVYSR